MTMQQIHYALVISEMGSLNKASEVLYVSQPSLTAAMQELERELGITIFHRSGRGVRVTNDGAEFLQQARQVYAGFASLTEKYGKGGAIRKKFGISTQHYSFAVKSFVELARQYNMAEYEFALRETKTREVIEDVRTARSEIGILYLNDFNRKAIEKILRSGDLEFHPLIDCDAFVYMWRGHPLAGEQSVCLEQLQDYPCMAFEQGDTASFYFAEEIFSTIEYRRLIRVNDRATMLNLMVGLLGYTLCSGIICEELNGSDYVAVPFRDPGQPQTDKMTIGYIVKKNMLRSDLCARYIAELKKYLGIEYDE